MICRRQFLRAFRNNINFKRCHWNTESVQIPVGNRTMDITVGKTSKYSSGSATVTCGGVEVVAVAVAKIEQKSTGFVPLTVDTVYNETPTHIMSHSGILNARMIDRSVRPLFPPAYFCDTQLTCHICSSNDKLDHAVHSINAASAALSTSDVPWNGPVGAVQVGMIDEDVVINPTPEELQRSRLNMFVSASEKNKIVMIDAAANILPPRLMEKALVEGLESARMIASGIKSLGSKTKRESLSLNSLGEEVEEEIRQLVGSQLRDVFLDFSHLKLSRDQAVQAVKDKVSASFKESHPDVNTELLPAFLNQMTREAFRNVIHETGRRCDGRSVTDLRNILCEVDGKPMAHGSSLFQRGQTQVACTLGFHSQQNQFNIPFPLSGSKERNFTLQYLFPPHATNEIGRLMIGRREIGHGALAGKALRPVVPPSYEFPIKLFATVYESNGSSSMASVCAGSLALLDAGVPISEPVSGVAMGLISKLDKDSKEIVDYELLTDQMGMEDYMGDMDFKIAGTRRGLTAMQMDTKLQGLPLEIVLEAVQKAEVANGKILDIMSGAISEPRPPKENRPVVETVVVPTSKRFKFLGVGGCNIKNICNETGVTISSVDDLEYQIFAPLQSDLENAKSMIEKIMAEERAPEFKIGSICLVKIVELEDNGVYVSLHPALPEILIPNSMLSLQKGFAPSQTNYAAGQEIRVKYLGPDPLTGRIKLSKLALELPDC